MFARVTNFEGAPGGVEEGLRIYREEVLPWLREASGFRGFVALVDSGGEAGLGISFWATREEMEADESRGGVLRDEVAAAVGVTITQLGYYGVAMVDSVALETR